MTSRYHSWKDKGAVQVPADMKIDQLGVLHCWECTRCGLMKVAETKPARNLRQDYHIQKTPTSVEVVEYNCAEILVHEIHSS